MDNIFQLCRLKPSSTLLIYKHTFYTKLKKTCEIVRLLDILSLLQSERPKLYGVLTVLSAVGLIQF